MEWDDFALRVIWLNRKDYRLDREKFSKDMRSLMLRYYRSAGSAEEEKRRHKQIKIIKLDDWPRNFRVSEKEMLLRLKRARKETLQEE
jgi:hypothetical protein